MSGAGVIALTCSTTSTAYELPFDFCDPSKRDPLYSSVRETPNCLLLAGGGGVISTGTGILVRWVCVCACWKRGFAEIRVDTIAIGGSHYDRLLMFVRADLKDVFILVEAHTLRSLN